MNILKKNCKINTYHSSTNLIMLMYRTCSFFIFMLIAFPCFLKAQKTYFFDIDKSIELAKKQSYTMRLLQQDLENARYELKAAKSNYMTHVNLNFTAPDYSETIRQWEDSSGINFYPVKQLYYSGDLTINQPLPTDGNLFIRSGLYNTDDYDEDMKYLRFNTKIGFEQPLEAFYAYNRIKSEFERAELNYEKTRKRLRRVELNIIYEVSQSFYNLLSAKKRKEIAEEALDRQLTSFQIAKNKYAAGLIREVEAMQMEVDLGQARNDYDLAKVNDKTSANFFKQYLGLSLGDSIVVDSDLDYQVVEVDLDFAVQHGLANRTEIDDHKINMELSEINLKRIKSRGMISGGISAYYDMIGVDDNPLPIPLRQAFENTWELLSSRPGNYGVALRISIPLIDWGENKARVSAAKAMLKKEEIRLEEEMINIEREIINTVNRLKSALRRLQLLEKDLKIAKRSFDISQSRFANGDINSETLALDRERLNRVYLSHLEAFVSYKLLAADLMRKTFYNFEANQSTLD